LGYNYKVVEGLPPNEVLIVSPATKEHAAQAVKIVTDPKP